MAAPKKRRTRKRRLPTAHRYPRTRTYTHAPLALKTMLAHLASQLSLRNLYILLFYILIAGNLIMMLRQKSLIFFLGYKIILLIYVG